MRISALIAGAALIVGTPAFAGQRNAPPEARLAQALAGRTAGRPVSCISLNRVRSSRIFERTAILYEVGSTFYVNHPRMGAESLRSDDILVTRTSSGQLCRLDTVNLLDRGSRIRRGFVGLGDFVPYPRPPRVR